MIDEVVKIGQEKNIVGIYTPAEGKDKKLLVVFINAGFIHRVGPQRYYVKLSRILSQKGCGSVRIDLPGIGDSQAFKTNMDADTLNYFAVLNTLNYFFEKKGYSKFCLLGFCSGAKTAFLAAKNDSRVCGVICVNDIYFENPRVFEHIYPMAYKRQKIRYYKKNLFKLSRWIKILSGKSNALKNFDIKKIAKRFITKNKPVNVNNNEHDNINSLMKVDVSAWENIISRGGEILHVFSEGSISLDFYELLFRNKFKNSKINQKITIHSLKNIDHNFTIIKSQETLTNIISKWFDEKIEPGIIKDEEDVWHKHKTIEKENPETIDNIFIILEYSTFYIGDNCKLLAQLSLMKKYYRNAQITINSNVSLFNEMAGNNPSIFCVENKELEGIDFKKYQIIYVCSFYENNVSDYFISKFDTSGKNDLQRIYSISSLLDPFVNRRFPINNCLSDFVNKSQDKIEPAIYLSQKEVERANEWLENNEVTTNDKLLIYLKGTTNDSKLLNEEVELRFLSECSQKDKKIFIYDDDKGTNRLFFQKKLNDNILRNFIFAPKMGLREAMAILASNYIHIIFGPTTGFMHCASEIYKNLISSGQRIMHPKILAYFGENEFFNYDEWWWWKNSLVKVLYPKEEKSNAVLQVLNEGSYDKSMKNNNILSTNKISWEMLNNYLKNNNLIS